MPEPAAARGTRRTILICATLAVAIGLYVGSYFFMSRCCNDCPPSTGADLTCTASRGGDNGHTAGSGFRVPGSWFLVPGSWCLAGSGALL